MPIEVTEKGIDELFDKLTSTKLYKKALVGAGELVCKRAKNICPKDTGRLAGSISTRYLDAEHAAEVYTPVFYSFYVEYGTGIHAEGGKGRKDVPWVYRDDKGDFHSTSGQKPKAFMRRSLTEEGDKVVASIAEVLF